MSGTLGIENLKKVVDLGIELEKLTAHMIKNGKDWAADMETLFAEVPALIADVQALVAGGAQVPAEFKDLDAAEGVELIGYVSAKLIVDDAKAQAIVVASLKLVSDLVVDGAALAAAVRS